MKLIVIIIGTQKILDKRQASKVNLHQRCSSTISIVLSETYNYKIHNWIIGEGTPRSFCRSSDCGIITRRSTAIVLFARFARYRLETRTKRKNTSTATCALPHFYRDSAHRMIHWVTFANFSRLVSGDRRTRCS